MVTFLRVELVDVLKGFSFSTDQAIYRIEYRHVNDRSFLRVCQARTIGVGCTTGEQAGKKDQKNAQSDILISQGFASFGEIGYGMFFPRPETLPGW